MKESWQDAAVIGGAVVVGALLLRFLRVQNVPEDGATDVAGQAYPVYAGGVGSGGGTLATVPVVVPTFDFSNIPPVSVPDVYVFPDSGIPPVDNSFADRILATVSGGGSSAGACGCGTSQIPSQALVTSTPSPYVSLPYPPSAPAPSTTQAFYAPSTGDYNFAGIYPPQQAAPNPVFGTNWFSSFGSWSNGLGWNGW